MIRIRWSGLDVTCDSAAEAADFARALAGEPFLGDAPQPISGGSGGSRDIPGAERRQSSTRRPRAPKAAPSDRDPQPRGREPAPNDTPAPAPDPGRTHYVGDDCPGGHASADTYHALPRAERDRIGRMMHSALRVSRLTTRQGAADLCVPIEHFEGVMAASTRYAERDYRDAEAWAAAKLKAAA